MIFRLLVEPPPGAPLLVTFYGTALEVLDGYGTRKKKTRFTGVIMWAVKGLKTCLTKLAVP
jgi:hypothetical protein